MTNTAIASRLPIVEVVEPPPASATMVATSCFVDDGSEPEMEVVFEPDGDLAGHSTFEDEVTRVRPLGYETDIDRAPVLLVTPEDIAVMATPFVREVLPFIDGRHSLATILTMSTWPHWLVLVAFDELRAKKLIAFQTQCTKSCEPLQNE